jgi:predicted dehydrogenase
MRKIGIGMIGAGAELDRYLETGLLSLRDEVDFVACFSRRPERAKEGAAKIGARPYTHLGDLLSDPGVEAVIVATPHSSHAEITLSALAAGRHVLVEKPISTTLADARNMIRAAEKARRVLAVYENYHFFEPFLRARRLIEEGVIGPLVAIRAHRVAFLSGPWLREGWRQQGDFSGILIDQACHYIDGLRLLAGEEIVQVAASATTTREDFRGDDTVMMNLRFASGLLGQAFFTWGSRTPNRGAEAEVFGKLGSLTVYRRPVGLELHKFDLPDEKQTIIEQADYAESFVPTIADFCAAVRGEREPFMSGLEGFRDLAVVDAAKRSISSGRVEAVEEFGTLA